MVVPCILERFLKTTSENENDPRILRLFSSLSPGRLLELLKSFSYPLRRRKT
jgi:hypothetical protein